MVSKILNFFRILNFKLIFEIRVIATYDLLCLDEKRVYSVNDLYPNYEVLFYLKVDKERRRCCKSVSAKFYNLKIVIILMGNYKKCDVLETEGVYGMEINMLWVEKV